MTTILNYFHGLDKKEEIKELLFHDKVTIINADTEEMALNIALNNPINLVITEFSHYQDRNLIFLEKYYQIAHKTPFIFIYDYIDDSDFTRLAKFECEFIKRPFQRSELVAAMEAILKKAAA